MIQKWLLLFFLFFNSNIDSLIAQSNSIPHSKGTPDSIIFNNYLDSIEKYVYQDSRKIIKYLDLCEEMIREDKALTNTNRFEFVIQNIYYEYTQDNTLGVFKIIETNKKMLEYDDIPYRQKKNFKYLDAYTSMTLGDIEVAQSTLHQLLGDAIEKKDTSVMFQSMISLSDILILQKDYDSAEKNFLDAYELIKNNKEKSTHKIHLFLKIVELYSKKGDFKNAKHYNELALIDLDSLEILDLKFDFLLQKVNIHLQEKNIDAANLSYQELWTLSNKMQNPSYLDKCNKVYARILNLENRPDKALSIFENLIAKEEQGSKLLTKLLEYYESAHTFANNNNNPDKAYQYILKANEIKDSLAITEQLQKTQYLEVKFDVKQKQKENEVLAAQISQNKANNKFLGAVAFIFLLLIFILLGAYLQKRKYNNLLEDEVKNRTVELEKTNEELNQFNNILSHDLKEPLRSIVGFSQLMGREIDSSGRAAEYLGYIKKSGQQLHQLIDDVAHFQQIGTRYSEDFMPIDTNEVVESILFSINTKIEERNAKITSSPLPFIYSNKSLTFLVFKNLIENGIKYNENSIPTVHISYVKEVDRHRFLFEDNGIGIAHQFHEKVFEMFKRLNTRDTYNGSGLGLNIVKKLMGKVKGDVEIISSEEGRGSVFEVSFPIIEEKEVHFYKMNIPSSN